VTLRNIILLLLALCSAGISARAQNPPAPVPLPTLDALGLPLDEWLAGGDRAEITWRVDIRPARLQLHQRLIFTVRVEVPCKSLAESEAGHRLLLIARLAGPDGRWHENAGVAAHELPEDLPGNAVVTFNLQAQVLPGDYTVGVVLYDRATKLHSVARRPLRVRPLQNDPLPAAWKNLPTVEFLDPPGPPRRRVSRLWLPVETSRPLAIDLLVNFSSSEQFAGRRWVDRMNVDVMTTLLFVLAQMNVPHGTLRATGVDLLRRHTIFEGRRMDDPGWSRIFEELSAVDAGVIDASDLISRRENPAFFREVFADRAAQICSETRAAAAAENPSAVQPQRVLIVISSGILFSHGADLTPVRPVAGCDLRVIHLRYQINRSNLWDQLEKVLRPLHPRRFEARSPETFRRALAALLAELSRL